jgi:ribonuclease VapC
MVIDTSAIIAYLEGEPAAARIAAAFADAPQLLISSVTVVEAGIVAEARRGEPAGRELDLLLHRLNVKVVPVAAEHAELARAAWRRYGKGRHPAGLNFGDCFAYSLAAERDEPLLFVGGDFSQTDIRSALT